MHRHLFDLARRGYAFPRPGVFRDLAPAGPQPAYPGVRVRVTRSFYGLRRLLEAGEVVQLAEPDAAEAVALGRAERV